MKARLLFKDSDFDADGGRTPQADDVARDLGLDALFDAMAAGDEHVRAASRAVLLSEAADLETIAYRQEVLKDCLKNRAVVRKLYALILEAKEREKRSFLWFQHMSPSSVLFSALGTIGLLLDGLRDIRNLLVSHASDFGSDGFSVLIGTLEAELSDRFLRAAEDSLGGLRLGGGALVSAELGEGLKGTRYALRKKAKSGIIRRVKNRRNEYQFQVAESDEDGARDLESLLDRGVDAVAGALAKSKDHIVDFLGGMRFELAFFIGCVNLHERLSGFGMGVAFPVLVRPEERELSFSGLYDPGLALASGGSVVTNDLAADGGELILITGANQGGKTTFLRGIGTAQLMMQCGMFVAAESYAANLCASVLTHFRRQEDSGLKSGKLDEELGRMSDLVDLLRENSMILLNESFAATNEREGSEIAGHIVAALLDRRVKVAFVTHLYAFAASMRREQSDRAVFLRAQRLEDGTRTYKLLVGEPLETSFGKDLYADIFETEAD